jgi:Response regulators consisting of a CheY-like receiver domain and a winged-helix DNA-binding domain
MRHGVCLHLELDGCACYAVPNVPSAIHRDDLGSFDLVVCGLTAGLFEAQHIIEAVRRASGATYVPILMIATNATRAAAIVGLEQGADGFLVKPFGFRELVASVRALLRTRPAGSGVIRRRRPGAIRVVCMWKGLTSIRPGGVCAWTAATFA